MTIINVATPKPIPKKEKSEINGELCDIRRKHEITLNEMKTKHMVEKTLND